MTGEHKRERAIFADRMHRGAVGGTGHDGADQFAPDLVPLGNRQRGNGSRHGLVPFRREPTSQVAAPVQDVASELVSDLLQDCLLYTSGRYHRP